MDSHLAGQRCLITGGTSGIGLGIARALAGEGVRLILAACDEHPEDLRSLRAAGAEACFLPVDLSTEAAAMDMARQALGHWGGLDLFVNNAARAFHEPVTGLSRQAFEATLNTNLAPCLWAGREIARHMVSRRSGSILIVGSTVEVVPAYREAAYRISKTGLRVYMETLAIELAPFGIRVNMLMPGFFQTRLTAAMDDHQRDKLLREIPLRRPGNTEDCGQAAAFLLSSRLSPYTTGAVLRVDGGLGLRPLPLLEDGDIAKLNG